MSAGNVPARPAESGGDAVVAASPRYRTLVGGARWVVGVATTITVVASCLRAFDVALPGQALAATHFFYLVAAVLLPCVFLIFPVRRGRADAPIGWFDWFFAAATFVIFAFCFGMAEAIDGDGWEFAPTPLAIGVALSAWCLLMEVARRAAGVALAVVAGTVSLYPVIADSMPALLDGLEYSLVDTVAFHLYSAEGFQGIPMRAFADWAIGYLVFGVILQLTGGATFFLALTFALMGRVRGGSAKVAIVASGVMGSISGSVVSNVLTTGAVTIPAMRRSGFSPTYAAGVEACASTGGVLMPPIMGAAAFVMARYLGVSYSEVALAAVIPSVLYFFGLFMQIDAYSARNGLQGIEGSRLPAIAATLLRGSHYVLAFVLLAWLMLGLHWHREAPYIAALFLVLSAGAVRLARRGERPRVGAGLAAFAIEAGTQLVELVGILAPVGVIVGALMMTGVVGNLTYDMVAIAGSNVLALLFFGALTSFVLGIGMTVVAAYIFLAVTLAPILIQVGIEPMAAHMFILYWGMLSYITPPVAIGAFAAAGLAGASPMRSGFEAMRLGSIIYFIPFFFVLSPTLLGFGSATHILIDLSTAILGITLIAGGLQGYLVIVGHLGVGVRGYLVRSCVLLGGALLAFPSGV
ncbi:MAG: TRAP transporter fused permease subunit [Chromatiales bacterium]|jgi:TRAP transporter 4TM/12TM fusion protein|nr:TRAP transporter fused permease subunit [Chromatiales bacterium]